MVVEEEEEQGDYFKQSTHMPFYKCASLEIPFCVAQQLSFDLTAGKSLVVSRALSQQQAEQRGLVEMSATVLYAAASHRDKFGFNLKAPLQEQQNCKRLASAARQTVLAWTRVTNPNPHRHRARHYPPPGVENRPSPLSPPTKPKKRVAAEPPVAAADASSTSYSPFSLSLAFV
ncbi:unnamed protein product [Mesocestoides corti]|uniref:Uncharacterized protein n=1 Tax=Mesocestoides corti TaxID=53468 RepID=A0A0R3UKA6_MESCO|nr:unnamed protein product [Mesocestoides corti]